MSAREPTPSELLPPEILPPGVQLPPISFTLAATPSSPGQLRIIRVGHAAVLVQWGDDTLLTDPWFSQKGSFPGYYSGESLAMGVEALPRLTGVLGSMDHWDHFDMKHFAAYRDHAVPIIVPAGTRQGEQAAAAGFHDVRALSPWQSVQLGAFRVTAVCAKPEQPPTAFEYEHAYVMEVAGRSLLFCAHLMTRDVQAEVKKRFGRIDVALLGINGLSLKHRNHHQLSMSPSDAAALCARLGVKVVVPVHYTFHGNWASNAFIISHRGTPEALADAAHKQAPATTVITLKPGKRLAIRWGFDTRNEEAAVAQKQKSLLDFFAKLDAGDLGAFELFAPNFVHHKPLPGAGDNTREGARRGFSRLREAVPDLRLKVESLLVEGEGVAVRLSRAGTVERTVAGLHLPLGHFDDHLCMLYRFDGAQIAEEWIDSDASTAAWDS
jgi:L-ascorbate metabolism protein UlaG (beta-lactamase superfamily)/predicted ester cyclase